MKNRHDDLERLRQGIDTLVRVLKIADATQLPDGKAPLNPSDSQTLIFVAMHEGCIGSDIAKFLGVSATTVSAIVDRLVRRGLVRRERTEANRRVVLLSVTPDGRKAAEAILDEQRKHCALMLEALSPSSRRDFVNHISKIAQKIEPQ